MKIREIERIIEEFAPLELAAVSDNVGLLVGTHNAEVDGVIVCVDVTPQVIDEAISHNCNLIVAHHPVIYDPLKHVFEGDVVHTLILKQLNVYAAHTNFDRTKGGLCEDLCRRLGINVEADFLDGFGKVGYFPCAMNIDEACKHVQRVLSIGSGVISVNSKVGTVHKVAVTCGGGGSISAINEAFSQDVDLYITGDVKYSAMRFAANLGYAIIDAGHFETEVHFVEMMANMLSPHVRVQTATAETASFHI